MINLNEQDHLFFCGCHQYLKMDMRVHGFFNQADSSQFQQKIDIFIVSEPGEMEFGRYQHG